MAKPVVQVRTAKVMYIGRVAQITVEITAEKTTKCDAIRARLWGEQGWAVGGGKSRSTRRVLFPRPLEFELSGPTELAANVVTPFWITVELPHGMAPSHDVDPAYARCELRVHVSIPWRIDGRYRFLLPVGVAPPAVVERTPYAIRSNPSSSAADHPRIELSLGSMRLIAGETLVGTCAVFHMDDKNEREVEISLVPMLSLKGWSDRERRGAALTSVFTLPAGSAGRGVPFRLALPPTMTPSFETVTHHLTWWLVARTGSFFGGRVDVSVPLEIVDASATATTAKLLEAPRLGDQRIATLFAAFAAKHGWRGGDPDADTDDPPSGQFSIEKYVGEAVVRIAYDYRGEDGTFLVSRVEHHTLGLGLAISPSSTVRHVFWKDIEVDISAWDRAHHVTARSAEQTIPFLRAVVPSLMKAPLGPMRRWSDTELVFDLAMTSLNEDALTELATALEDLARTIDAAEAKIQPPARVVVDLDAWRSLAARCKGHLAVGDLSIDGLYDGVPVAISPVWAQSTLCALRISYGSPEHAGEALKAISLALSRPAHDVLGRDVAEPLVELCTRWPDDLSNLRVADGVAAVSLLLPGVATLDATRVRELIETLRAVLAALGAPGNGPYR